MLWKRWANDPRTRGNKGDYLNDAKHSTLPQVSFIIPSYLRRYEEHPPADISVGMGIQTIPIAISTSTQVVDTAGGALSLSALKDGDSLRVTGSHNLVGGIDAALVQDLSLPGTTTTYPYTVAGTLAWNYVNVLCVPNASVVSHTGSVSATPLNACPSGDLSVGLTSSTHYENASGRAISFASLRLGDSLLARGAINSGRFTAALVQDLSH